MMKYLIFLFLPIAALGQEPTDSITVIELSQEEQNKMEFGGVFKSSVGFELAGKSGWAGASYDVFLSPRFRLGVGAGFMGAGVDLKFYPWPILRSRYRFNAGIRSNVITGLNATPYVMYSLPVGFTYFATRRINFDLDAGPMAKLKLGDAVNPTGWASRINYIWVSAKISYRFSFYAMRRAKRLAQTGE